MKSHKKENAHNKRVDYYAIMHLCHSAGCFYFNSSYILLMILNFDCIRQNEVDSVNVEHTSAIYYELFCWLEHAYTR